MGIGKNFQLNKISRLIKSQGEEFTFKRFKKNEFNEPISDDFDEIKIVGVYHETNSQVTETTSEGTSIKTKPQPRILCMPDQGSKVERGDMLEHKGIKFKVIEPANLLLYDICADISMVVVENGK